MVALPKKSLAMVQTATRRLEPMDLPLPEIDDDSALLQLEACGICGSDYEQFEGQLRTPMPVVPGHEPLGRIAKIGDRAAARWGVDVGDRVAVETMISCRHCDPCLGGTYHLCRSRKIYSYVPLSEAPGLWGAYAQYMYLHPNSVVHRMSPTLPAALAVMFTRWVRVSAGRSRCRIHRSATPSWCLARGSAALPASSPCVRQGRAP